MDKLNLSNVGGFPFLLDDKKWEFGRLDSPNQGVYQAFNNLLRGFGDDFIVQGCITSGTTPNVAITEGWVILGGELIKVDAQTGINTATDNKFFKVTTFDPRGTKTFQNSTMNETYEKNRAIIQGTSGNLAFDGNRIFETDKILADGSKTIVVIKTRIFEIGDWNMDIESDPLVSIIHGISGLISKARSITGVIIRDGTIITHPFTHTDVSGESGVGVTIGSTDITLIRATNGVFDSSNFADLSFNRGFVTIVYEV